MKKGIGFLILILGVAITLTAQTSKIDSLREVLRKDTTNFDGTIQLAKSLVDVRNVEALLLAKKARVIAIAKNDTFNILHASRAIGQIYNRLGDVEGAIRELSPLLRVAEFNHYGEEVKMILNSLAASFMNKAEFDKALEFHFKSLVLREKENNKKDISITLNNIGAVYIASSNYEQALIYLARCLALKGEIRDSFDMHRLYGNLGSCYLQTGDYEKSELFFAKAVKACGFNCPKGFLMFIEYSMGESYRYQKQLEKSKEHFASSLALAVTDSHSQYQLLSLLGLAQIALEQSDLVSLKGYLGRITRLQGKEPFLAQMQLFYSLSSDYCFRKGNFKNAFLFQKKYLDIGEKLNSSKVHKKIMDVQLRFAERENFQKIQAQAELLNAQNVSIQKQKKINLLLVSVAFLTIILILVLFKRNRRKSEINKILDQLVKERTSELERNRLDLQHLYNEQSIVLDKVCRDLISSLATIQGLNNVAAMENFVNADVYLRAAETTLFKSIRTIRGNVSSDYSGV